MSARAIAALLLAAGQLGRAVATALGEADALEQRVERSALHLASRDGQRQQDVLLGIERRQEVEGLKDEADVPAAQLGQRLVAHRRDVLRPDVDAARRRAIEPGEQVHERRLA
jgi:hypothetical protein